MTRTDVLKFLGELVDGEGSLDPYPVQPTGLWAWDGLEGQDSPCVGLDVPIGDLPDVGMPSHSVWPWLNSARARCGNAAQRRLRVIEWIDNVMDLTGISNGTDGTEAATEALAGLAGGGPGVLQRMPTAGLWTDRRSAREFVVAWWRYLALRWEVFGEWPDPVTQLVTLHLLTTWITPEACVRQSIAGSFKGVYPHRSDINRGLYEVQTPILVSATRRFRTPYGNGATVRDTVLAYRLVSPQPPLCVLAETHGVQP